MLKQQEPRQSRTTTHFKFYSEKYLWGSTKHELEPDERSVWLDFLCLATMNFGIVEIFSREHSAKQLLIEPELLDRSIEKFIKYGKVKKRQRKKEKKEIFEIIKWNHYQADYLTKREHKSGVKEEKIRVKKSVKSDTENPPTLKKRRVDKTTVDKTTVDNTKSNKTKLKESKEDKSKEPINYFGYDFNESNQASPSPEANSFSEGERDSISQEKEEFLSKLRECPGYPFDEYDDGTLFHYVIEEYPDIDILQELEKKIEWWKDHPDALKEGGKTPHAQLCEWFYKEQNFQTRGKDE